MNKPTIYKRINTVLLSLLLLTALGLIGTTYAFYSSSSSIQNMLITKNSDILILDYFNLKDLWLPGETKEKAVWFGNQSEHDQVIRFKVTTSWFDNNGTPQDLEDDSEWNYTGSYSPAPLTVNWTNEITGSNPAWTKIGDYYYYNQVLSKKTGSSPTVTPIVIDSVTFSPALCNCAHLDDDFSNKACRISIRMESLAVNSEHTKAAWKVSFTQEGSALSWSSTNTP